MNIPIFLASIKTPIIPEPYNEIGAMIILAIGALVAAWFIIKHVIHFGSVYLHRLILLHEARQGLLPSCYGSQPDAQARAENDCYACRVAADCLIQM